MNSLSHSTSRSLAMSPIIPVAVAKPLLRVIHPLDDAPEVKKFIPHESGRMHMSLAVKLSLGALRAYLILITALVLVRVVQLSGIRH